MIWIPIAIMAVFLIICAVVYYFFRMAFVKKNSRAYVDEIPRDGKFANFREIIDAGYKWYEGSTREDVYITSYDGLKLHGEIIPFKEATDKTIILFHGYRSIPKKDFSCAIPYYNSLGLNIVLVDQRSHGQSEGKLITYGVKERFDVRSWVEYVKEKFPNTKIYLSGISMGASTVMMASDILEGVNGIIADCGFTSPKDIIQIVAKSRFGLPKWFCSPVGLVARLFCGFDYSYSSKESLSKTKIPFLFIHGEADDFVPCFMTEQNYEACSSKKDKIIVSEATHGLSFLFEPERVKAKLENFILNNEE